MAYSMGKFVYGTWRLADGADSAELAEPENILARIKVGLCWLSELFDIAVVHLMHRASHQYDSFGEPSNYQLSRLNSHILAHCSEMACRIGIFAKRLSVALTPCYVFMDVISPLKDYTGWYGCFMW